MYSFGFISVKTDIELVTDALANKGAKSVELRRLFNAVSTYAYMHSYMDKILDKIVPHRLNEIVDFLRQEESNYCPITKRIILSHVIRHGGEEYIRKTLNLSTYHIIADLLKLKLSDLTPSSCYLPPVVVNYLCGEGFVPSHIDVLISTMIANVGALTFNHFRIIETHMSHVKNIDNLNQLREVFKCVQEYKALPKPS